ncbi:hypothetical protein HNP52_003349 [Sphingomonas kyeonggiensis]|uniref:Uncharacterized protein n=1 Tax=Sphingomonas kyeonggiensis TaxID=1268553 RepID=A0A7W7NTR7_9SPHN|nr:hypothetical protein [Sphingomonas kyeonggiensis]MBB4840257.1 hypothetical protein [Sphingomonas kyeonggiensis]
MPPSTSEPTRRSAARSETGRPNSETSPSLGRISPSAMRIVVLLPAPFGPRKP